jgi:hypothetical protein
VCMRFAESAFGAICSICRASNAVDLKNERIL